MNESNRPMGMRAFIIIWIGQIVSILGSAMTGFGVTIWLYGETEKATALALGGFFFVTPMLIFSPIAGAIVDRYDRKLMMIISDLAAGFTTIIMLLLYASDNLQLGHILLLNAFSGTFQTFQWPAFSAILSVMLPKKHYGRAHGMLDLGGSSSRILAPLLAGALLSKIHLEGIMLIDIATFVFAVGALLFVRIPKVQTSQEGQRASGSIWQESLYGFGYIFKRPSLLGLQTVFLIGNFFSSLSFIVFAAMILARTGQDEQVFGTVQSLGAAGGMIGALAMTAWGGPRRRVHGVLGGWIFTGLLGTALLGLGRSLPIWAVGSFLGQFVIPILNGSNQAIWQAKVPPDLQGRVFSTRRLIAWFVTPISALLAGPLVDLWLEPAMAPGGSLADTFGGLVGTGPGAGMALLFVFGGVLAALVGLGGYAVHTVRNVEDILPEHDALPAEPDQDKSEPLPDQAALPWSTQRKIGAALASALLIATIVGLGWLQAKVLMEQDSDQATTIVAEADLQATKTPESQATPTAVPATSTATSRPTATPTPPATPTTKPDSKLAITPDDLIAGQSFTYTLVITNNGPSDASGVIVSDTLPSGVVLNSATPSQGDGCSQREQTIFCALGDLADGANAVITVSVTPLVSSTLAVHNAVSVAAEQNDPDTSDNTVEQKTMIYAGADLAISLSGLDAVMAGASPTYTLNVVNNGPLTASGVIVTGTLPVGVVAGSASASQGEGCAIGKPDASTNGDQASVDGAGTMVCDLGDLVNGASALITNVVQVDPLTRGQITYTAGVVANEPDPQQSNDLAWQSVTVNAQTDLSLQAQTTQAAIAGQELTLTFVISNSGPSAATNVVLSNTLPPELTFRRFASAQAACQELTGTITCQLALIDAGDSAEVTLVTRIDPATTGPIRSRASVNSSAYETDTNTSDNSLVYETGVETQANLAVSVGKLKPRPTAVPATPPPVFTDLAITSSYTGSLIAGTPLTYTLTVTNLGPLPATGVTLSSTLPPGMTSAGVPTFCRADGQDTSCDLGDLESGGVVTLELSVNLSSWLTGTITHTASVLASEDDPNPDNNRYLQTLLVNTQADLAIH